ncbi:MAG TPA: type II secretion system minor pseudopilin GspJ [Spongiibacteraceae bacterium]|nr:type II secretion system minor pseudopilin GspJ [Spongiibacteraceae bacterium]
MRHQRGLTLLELLIAISLFAMIAAASYRVLAVVADARELTGHYADRLGSLRRALSAMQRDMDQVVDRRYRDQSLKLQEAVRFDSDYPVILTRAGHSNPLNEDRSTLLRVAYLIGVHPDSDNPDSPFYGDERSWLLRAYWTGLDGELTLEDARVQALLPDIEILAAQAIVNGAPGSWPAQDASARLTGIALSFDHPQLGAVQRQFKLP